MRRGLPCPLCSNFLSLNSTKSVSITKLLPLSAIYTEKFYGGSDCGVAGGNGMQLLTDLVDQEIHTSVLYMANACCPIETEPKTLNQGQLNRAREVAADVVHKMEPHESKTVFIERSKTSVPLKELERIMGEINRLPQADEFEEKAPIVDLHCQCSCTPTTIETPDPPKLREPHTAPF